MSPVSQASEEKRALDVLTLTPFYPTERDDASGCFVSEPLDRLVGRGVRNTVFAMQPAYRAKSSANKSAQPAERFRYFALPGGIGLPTAGGVAFPRIGSRLRGLHRDQALGLIPPPRT